MTRLKPVLLFTVLAIAAAPVTAKAVSGKIVRADTPRLCVRTTPEGAAVTMSSGQGCDSTPCLIEGARKEVVTVTIEKEGYQTVQEKVGPEVTGLYAALKTRDEPSTGAAHPASPGHNTATGQISATIADPPDESEGLKILNCQ